MSFALSTAKSPVNLRCILLGGQSFRWLEVSDGVFLGSALDTVWKLSQSQNSDSISVYVLGSSNPILQPKCPGSIERAKSVLSNYLSLDVNLELLAREWIAADAKIAHLYGDYSGIRILRQDPVETLFAFICSANNNISRIGKMVGSLCREFGPQVPIDTSKISPTALSGEFFADLAYGFPSPTALAQPGVEERLRMLGFGYRAKYIHGTAKKLVDLLDQEQGSSESCSSGSVESETVEKTGDRRLRESPANRNQLNFSDFLTGKFAGNSCDYKSAHASLQEFPGVGAKVADCVCLMSLNHPSAVPIDTHVLQITCEHYMPELCKSGKVPLLNQKLYARIGHFYRERFGTHAGWAHDVLFCADLRHLKKQPSSKAKCHVMPAGKSAKKRKAESQ